MSAQLTPSELEAIWAAAAALPPPQRAIFQERVTAELKSLPSGMLGPGSLHRIIATAQQTLLRAGAVAVGPGPKHGGVKNAVAAAAKRAREPRNTYLCRLEVPFNL